MIVRSKLFIFCTLLACICASSCQKEGAELLSGSYTYKISGTVGLVPTDCTSSDTTIMNLETEQGQINIAKYGSNERIIITWNDMTGDACSTTATVTGASVKLDAAQKCASVKEGLLTYEGNVTYCGEGALYDNMLIIPMTYQGEFTVGLVRMKIVTSKIECIAKANQ